MGGGGSKSKGPAPVSAHDDQAEDDDQDAYDEESVESMQGGIIPPRKNQGSQRGAHRAHVSTILLRMPTPASPAAPTWLYAGRPLPTAAGVPSINPG